MNNPRLPFRILLLLLVFFSACTGEKDPAPDPTMSEAHEKAKSFLEKAKEARDNREKIAYFNQALAVIEDPLDTLLPILLENKIYYHNKLKEYDSSEVFADSLIEVARFQKDTLMLAKGFYRKSKIYFYKDEQEEVFRNAFEARNLYLKIGDSSGAGRRTLEMANAQNRMGDYSGNQESATEAIEYLNEATDSVYLSGAYNNIGMTYRNQGFFQDAISEYKNALRFSVSEKESLIYLNNLALVYRDQGNFEAAIEIFEEIVKKVDTSSVNTGARYQDNLAYTKWKQDPKAAVEDDLLEVMRVRQENNDREGLLASYSHLADYYKNKNPEKSKHYTELLLETSRTFGSATAELDALERLVEVSSGEAMKDYSLRYITLNDSINNANLKAQNRFAKIKFDEERKQQEIVSLEAQNALQDLKAQRMKARTITGALIALLLLIGLSFLIYYLRQRHKREKIREVHKTESRISKVIHDELANDIYNVMSSLEFVAPAPMIDKLERIYLRTRDISRENNDIDTGENYLDSLKAILSNNTPENSKLFISGEETVNWEKLEEEKKIVIYRVLQELMVNMKKHSEATLVAITFSQSGKFIEINYSDNGKGLSWNNHKKGNGLKNVENRIASLNGSIDVKSEPEKGFKVKIKVPGKSGL